MNQSEHLQQEEGNEPKRTVGLPTDKQPTFAEHAKRMMPYFGLDKKPNPSHQEEISAEEWRKFFKLPLQYAEDSGDYILDKGENIALNVRGWGGLINVLSENDAVNIQEQFAKWVVNAINSYDAAQSLTNQLQQENQRLKEILGQKSKP